MSHVLVGLAIGIFFGGTILAYTYVSAPEPPATAALIGRGVDEIVFPVGCSFVLFSAQALSNRMTSQDEEESKPG